MALRLPVAGWQAGAVSTIDWAAADREDAASVAAEARRWADAAQDSPLYRTLALGIAQDPELLDVLAAIDNVPPMNLLLGAVKLTLRQGDALAAWYPHLTAHPADAGPDALAAFRDHVLARRERLLALASARRTQTNEIGRAAVLLPWIPAAGPVHAIDVGASAGLNLCLDRFRFEYTGAAQKRLGIEGPTVACETRGPVRLPAALPVLATRTGIDLAPVDAANPDAAAWLEALVWPEHQDRLDRLRGAVAVRRDVDLRLVAGDAATALADVLATLPPGPAVVWHTIALYQADARVQADIDAAVEEGARRRKITRIGFEPVEDGAPQVRVGPAFARATVVARAHAHGRWLEPVS